MLDTLLSVTKFRKYFTFKLLTSKVTRVLYFCIIELLVEGEVPPETIIELLRKLVALRWGRPCQCVFMFSINTGG